MNVENMKKLRDQLTQLPEEKFYMWGWIDHRCGTRACIAGWCSILNGGPTRGVRIAEFPASARFAQEFLGLTKKEAVNLFNGHWYGSGPLVAAIAELDRMIATEPQS